MVLFNPKLLMTHIHNALVNKLDEGFNLNPYFLCFYVSFRCNFYCGTCIKSDTVKEFDDADELSTWDVIKLLTVSRKETHALDITGGEPLLRDDIEQILEAASRLNFNPIFLNTNASRLHNFPNISRYVDYFIVSMTSPNPQIFSRRTGIPVNTASQTLDNIISLAKDYPAKLIINNVIDPQNIEESYRSLDFINKQGGRITFVPDNRRINEFKNNSDYQKFLNELQDSSLYGLIVGGQHYYNRIRVLEPVDCHPEIIAEVSPSGHLYSFCEERGHQGASVLEAGGIKKAFQTNMALRHYDYDNKCTVPCYKIPCIVTNALIEKPLTVALEMIWKQ